MQLTATPSYVVRPYSHGDEQAMADLVNASRNSDAEVYVTEDMIRDEWSDPRLNLERDTLAAISEDGTYLAAVEIWFGDADYDSNSVIRHIGFTLRPELSESHHELMESIFERGLEHAINRPFAQPDKHYVLRAWASALDQWKCDWLESHGFALSHVGYTLIYDALGELPIVRSIPGFHCEPGSPERDSELRNAVNAAFADDPTYTPLSGSEWDTLFDSAANPDAHWVLAIEDATDRVVGFAVAEIDRATNEATGARDGWITDLAVLPGYRGYRLGRTLVLKAMNDLRDAGMSAIKMGVDSLESPRQATRLHRSLGFRIQKGSHTYQRSLN